MGFVFDESAARKLRGGFFVAVGPQGNERWASDMAQGTVKWFSEDKGYSFITPDDGGNDLFVPYSAIDGTKVKPLNEREKVTYEAGQGKRVMTVTGPDDRTGSGGTKDNVGDELDVAAGRGRRERDARREAAPEAVRQPGSGGVKDNVRDEWAKSQERR